MLPLVMPLPLPLPLPLRQRPLLPEPTAAPWVPPLPK